MYIYFEISKQIINKESISNIFQGMSRKPKGNAEKF